MSERLVVIDTETTGVSAQAGHRIVEVAAVEMVAFEFTGNNFHRFVNPKRKVSEEFVRITGITKEFLSSLQEFKFMAQDFVEFLGDARLVTYNARFELSFINMELSLAGYPQISDDRVIDILAMAKQKLPDESATLDNLSAYYAINSEEISETNGICDAKITGLIFKSLMNNPI